jgi:hypothetical protein
VPLAVTLTGGNRNDVTQLLPLVDGVGPVTGKRGRPRQRPERVIADRGYDHDKYRRELRRRVRIRWERDPDLHLAFLYLGCAVICQRMLNWP